jgi:PilZ domain
MNPAMAEKRREPRLPAHGKVSVHFSNPQRVEIQGELVDVSASGFRMSHEHQSLVAGQMVEFSHPTAAGEARVMWNRIVNRHVETGLLVVSRK